MADEKSQTVKFHYIKANDCREVRISGVFGGMNNQTGDLYMAVFSERPPIPRVIEQYVDNLGRPGEEVPGSRESRDGMVRIIQQVMYMDLATAIALHTWLDAHVNRFLKDHPNVISENNNK